MCKEKLKIIEFLNSNQYIYKMFKNIDKTEKV